MLNNLNHVDFLNLFALSIAFNFAYIIKTSDIHKYDNTEKIAENRGYFCFIHAWYKSIGRKLFRTFNKHRRKLARIDQKTDFLLKGSVKNDCCYIFFNTYLNTFFNKYLNKFFNTFHNEIHAALVKLTKRQAEIKRKIKHSKIPEHDHMFSICFLLGLYGILIQFVAPFFLKNNDINENIIFFNGNMVCLLFLILCVNWDSFHGIKKGRKFRIKYFRCLRPRRKLALLIFIGLCIYFVSGYTYHFINIPSFFFDYSIYFTAIVLYSAFIIYFSRVLIVYFGFITHHYLFLLTIKYKPSIMLKLFVLNRMGVLREAQKPLNVDSFDINREEK